MYVYIYMHEYISLNDGFAIQTFRHFGDTFTTAKYITACVLYGLISNVASIVALFVRIPDLC